MNRGDVEAEVDRLFEEASAYYLVGYQTSNGAPDGKFRKVEVKVKRPGVTVRTRSGFYAPKEGGRATTDQRGGPNAVDMGLTGMTMPASLPLRVAATPVGRANATGRDAEVAVVLTVRLPAPRGAVAETVTVVRTLYDGQGRPSAPIPEKIPLTLQSPTGDELRYDVYQRLTLPPGRYEIRLNATSAYFDRSGSVYADLEVPDFTRAAVSASGLVLGTRAAAARDRRAGGHRAGGAHQRAHVRAE